MVPIKSKSSGATIVEAAFAIPILFLMFLGLIDVCHYLYTRNGLSDAVQAGLTRASFEPDLESVNLELFESARHRIAELTLNRAADLIGSSKMEELRSKNSSDSEIVNIPPANALQTQPLRVRLRFEIPIFVSFGLQRLPLDIVAVGFREQPAGNTFPTAKDCQGNPYVPGLPFSGCSNNCTPESCGTNGTVTDPITCSCSCRLPYQFIEGSCRCPACPAGQGMLDPSTCSCGYCPPGKVLQNGQCICSLTCLPPLVLNSDQCQCVQPGCLNSCEENQVHLPYTNCQCGCPPGAPMDPATRRCTCPPGQFFDGNMCICPACTVRNDAGICVSTGKAPQCAGGMVLQNCTTCACPSGSANVYNDEGQVVGCSNSEG